ncbi:lipopolysaccharide biosynthesis protein [Lactococcus cremoris]|uniref:lipopolysaccharide biosynthesis protein n=1 Tax=Lactococcus lactis subsp. cremoris TaxID=1359 RepID=UPI002204C3CC|nr:lipopolysaccharide biosynthesis protein [Lactococcus cremoris]UXV61165.1 lipopolysaccharide biosynthesis protein [Lactococcus cremoris]
MQREFRTGILFTAIGQYSNILIQLIINVVLSRILGASDFGIVAITQVFLIFFQMIVTAGMGPAIIQNKSLKSRDYGILFNYSAIFAAVLGVLFGFLGFAVSYIYKDKIYIELFWLMALIVLAEGLNVVPNAMLAKEKRFKAINLRLLFSNLIGAVVGVIAALMGAGVFALVLSVVVPAIITLILNFFIVKIPFNTSFELSALKKVWVFSKNQLIFSIITYFARNTDNMLIGRFLGAAPLGNYSKAYGLTVMPNTVFTGVINPVLQPILSEHETNVELIKETYLKVVKMLAIIGFPLTAFIILNSKPIINLLFGGNWNAAVIPLVMLGLSIWSQMLNAATGAIFQSRNQTHVMLRADIISTILIVIFTCVGVFTGNIATIALLVSVAYMVSFFITNYMLMRFTLESNILSLLKILVKPIFLGVTSGLVLFFIEPFTNFHNIILLILVRGILWLITIIGFLALTGEYKFVKDFVKNKEVR